MITRHDVSTNLLAYLNQGITLAESGNWAKNCFVTGCQTCPILIFATEQVHPSRLCWRGSIPKTNLRDWSLITRE